MNTKKTFTIILSIEEDIPEGQDFGASALREGLGRSLNQDYINSELDVFEGIPFKPDIPQGLSAKAILKHKKFVEES